MLKQKDNSSGDAALVIKNPSRKTSPIRYMKPDECDVFGASGLTMLDLTVSDLAERTRAGDFRDGCAGMATRV
jgi:hypothetical protein